MEAEVESVVIDSNNFSVYDATGHERVWLRDLPHDPHYSRVRTATDAAYIFHSLQRLITTYVLFLDGANQAVALVPIPPTSKPRKEWLEREARRYGAETAIVGVQGDQAVDEMADHLEGIRMTNPAGSGIYSDVGGVVRDVINIDSRQPWADRKKGRRQLKLTMPMLESTLFQTPSTEVWALMEEGAEYDPETVKPEHGDWRKSREPRKLRSQRLEGARLRLIRFTEQLAQAAEEKTGLSDELRTEGIRIITETTVPKRTQEITAKAKEAATISQMRNVVAEARRAYTVQLKTYAIADLKGAIKGARLAKMHPDHLGRIRKLLRPFKLGGLADSRARAALGTRGTDTIRSESLDEIRALTKEIRAITHEHRTQRKMLGQERGKELAKVVKGIGKDIEERTDVLSRGQELDPLARLQSGAEKIEGKRRRKVDLGGVFAPRPADMLRMLSPELRRIVYEELAIKGQHEEVRLLNEFRDPVIRAFEVASGKKMGTRPFMQWYTETVEVGGVTLKRSEAMQLLLSFMDPTNAVFIIKHGVTVGRSKRHLEVTKDVYRHVQEFVGEEGQHAIQAIFDVLNGATKGALNKAWLEVYGYEVANVVDYVYRRIDWRDSDGMADPLENITAGGDPGITTWGHLKARVGTQNPLQLGGVLEVFGNFTSHAARISAYLVPAHNAMTVLTSLQSAIEDRVGEANYQRLKEAIKLQSVKLYERDPHMRLTRKLMRNISMGILALRPSTWFLNPAGLAITTGQEILSGTDAAKAWGWLAQALPAGADFRLNAIMERHSPYYRQRYSRNFMNEVTSGLTGEPAWSFGPRTLGEKGLIPLQESDKVGARVRWRMAELKVEDETDLEVGSDAFYEAVNLAWMKMMFDGENTSHGQDLTGALAIGRRYPIFASVVMFQSSVSKIYSLAWAASQEATQPGGSKGKAVAGLMAVIMSLAYATGVRLALALMDEDEDEMDGWEVLRRFGIEAAGVTPIVGSLLAPVVNRLTGKGAPFYQPSVLMDVFEDLNNVRGRGMDVWTAVVNQEVDVQGEAVWPEQTKKLLLQSVSLASKLRGFPWDGPEDMVKWATQGLRDDDDPWDETKETRPDTQQERWKMFQAWEETDMGLFREQVKAYTEKTGKKPTDRDLLGILNRRRDMSRLTKYEPGKPDRKKVSPMLLAQIDSELERREELRTTVRMMARANPDLVTMTPQGLPRVKRPTVKRPRVKRPGQR